MSSDLTQNVWFEIKLIKSLRNHNYIMLCLLSKQHNCTYVLMLYTI